MDIPGGGQFGGLTCMYDCSSQRALSAYKFTGKERDSESGLDNFGARYYGSSLGRFMEVDPVQMSRKKLLDPQQWNMYAYTRNNPLRFVDPDGREVKVLDDLALKRIKSTLPKDLRGEVAADKNGVLDRKAIDKIKSDDPNVKALQKAVDLKQTIEVKTDSKANGYNFEYKSVGQLKQEVQKAGGDASQITFPELYLGYTQSPSESPSGDFRVIISDATGEAAKAPESELAVTTAHEFYGHALLGAEGKAWEHDSGGPVDHQIKTIEDHTRSLYQDK
jgi:RHS repeat-associated protein